MNLILSDESKLQLLLKELNEAAEAYTPSQNGRTYLSTDTPRHKLLAAAKKLVTALEDPDEEMNRFALQPCAHACALAAWQRGILSAWPKERMTSNELAEHVKADRVLVVRIMRALIVYGIFSEPEEEVYEHNALSAKMSDPTVKGQVVPLALRTRDIAKLPEYLEHISYANPGNDPSQPTLFQWANKTDQEFFQWMQEQPDALQKFNASMAKTVVNERLVAGKSVVDGYPFVQELADAGPDEIVVVDVGGGYGHLLQELRTHLPEIKGKVVVEDLPETVKGALPIENAEVIPYNFFTQEQPVKGSRLYIMRHVLHDWSDHASREILKNTIPALVKGKSKLLLIEGVIAPTDAAVFPALMDVNMMKYGGMGRKERQWRELVNSVGLEIVKIHPPVKSDSFMEVVPKDWL